MLHVVTSKKSLEATGQTFEEAVAARQFGVLSVHDLKEKMNQRGIAFASECRVYEICNPRQASRVLEANLQISTALPCRVSIYEEAGTVKLATLKPTEMLRMFGDPGLDTVAQEVEAVIFSSMQEAAE